MWSLLKFGRMIDGNLLQAVRNSVLFFDECNELLKVS